MRKTDKTYFAQTQGQIYFRLKVENTGAAYYTLHYYPTFYDIDGLTILETYIKFWIEFECPNVSSTTNCNLQKG